MSAAHVSLAAAGAAISALISNCQGDPHPASVQPANCVIVTGAAASDARPDKAGPRVPDITTRCSATAPTTADGAGAGGH